MLEAAVLLVLSQRQAVEAVALLALLSLLLRQCLPLLQQN
jgi:hypothetical protein